MIRGLLTVPLLALTVACASSGAVPRPFPRPGGYSSPGDNAPVPARTPGPLAPLISSAIVASALDLRGIPYRNGGADRSGFDCSGLVAYVFLEQGIAMPRTVVEQFALGDRIDAEDIEPGDLVFFSTIAPGPSHVGIAISRGEFVHAPSSSGVVRVEPLSAPYWSTRYVGARRLR